MRLVTVRQGLIVLLTVVIFVCTSCGGSAASRDSTEAQIQGDLVVVDQEQLRAAQAELDEGTNGAEVASASETDIGAITVDREVGGIQEEGEEKEGIEVAEAEEDELDGLLNAVSVFTSCLDEEGFEFIGAPGQDGATAADFDSDYMLALGQCATASDILSALQAFGEAQADLTPDEIAQNNFGLPVFGECMADLGWEVADLIPDERGALGFGDEGFGLTPPEGTDATDFDDVNACRREAETYVEENYAANNEISSS